jgi:hypothetical protein
MTQVMEAVFLRSQSTNKTNETSDEIALYDILKKNTLPFMIHNIVTEFCNINLDTYLSDIHPFRVLEKTSSLHLRVHNVISRYFSIEISENNLQHARWQSNLAVKNLIEAKSEDRSDDRSAIDIYAHSDIESELAFKGEDAKELLNMINNPEKQRVELRKKIMEEAEELFFKNHERDYGE